MCVSPAFIDAPSKIARDCIYSSQNHFSDDWKQSIAKYREKKSNPVEVVNQMVQQYFMDPVAQKAVEQYLQKKLVKGKLEGFFNKIESGKLQPKVIECSSKIDKLTKKLTETQQELEETQQHVSLLVAAFRYLDALNESVRAKPQQEVEPVSGQDPEEQAQMAKTAHHQSVITLGLKRMETLFLINSIINNNYDPSVTNIQTLGDKFDELLKVEKGYDNTLQVALQLGLRAP